MNAAKTIIRLLTFRISREEILGLNRKFFFIGLVGTWIVGMGRYWDDPNAHWMQHMGLGSVIYIFILSFIIWAFIKPYWVEDWSYFLVLTFISLTSFPAILYAIPIERFLDLETAADINVLFLALVATWRLSLLYFFLRRFTRLRVDYIGVLTLLPVCIIITVLTILNLERAVFDIMGGLRTETSNDGAYKVLTVLSLFSVILLLPLVILYLVHGYSQREKYRARQDRQP